MSHTAKFYKLPCSDYFKVTEDLTLDGFRVELDQCQADVFDDRSGANVPIAFDFEALNQIAVFILNGRKETQILFDAVCTQFLKHGAVEITAEELEIESQGQ
ncbi:hypothetical protein [Prosthecobacter sp.]|uniref:hypothetical protein n=1 Tax=Prosthecobacter sp. TaxID=1965333 RepID=UPI0024877617|nr:hypothetical protein [Prosthecobacter sp.]MDI1312304.1 hypothetical protein [Prosthecobacter sp.]